MKSYQLRKLFRVLCMHLVDAGITCFLQIGREGRIVGGHHRQDALAFYNGSVTRQIYTAQKHRVVALVLKHLVGASL